MAFFYFSMRIEWRISLFMMLVILCSSVAFSVSDRPYHLKLLAVQEGAAGKLSGSDADLYLEIHPGLGRVFLDTYPATKMDTQISTRYAKDVACELTQVDCSKFDFIYTIQARTSIIGGPSAGAAVSALTSIALLDIPYSQDVAVTGTINSGGVVGPVGGVKEKIEAASSVGLHTVLIATGTANNTEFDNFSNSSVSVDLLTYGPQNLSVKVVEVTTLSDVVFYLTGKNVSQSVPSVVKNDQYGQIMNDIQNKLCDRARMFNASLFGLDSGVLDVGSGDLDANLSALFAQRFNRSFEAAERGDAYSAASFCFGLAIDLHYTLLERGNISSSEVSRLWSELARNLSLQQRALQLREIHSISDLQAKMIVEERLNDVAQVVSAHDKMDELMKVSSESIPLINSSSPNSSSDSSSSSYSNSSSDSSKVNDTRGNNSGLPDSPLPVARDTISSESLPSSETLPSSESLHSLSFALERLYTAQVWQSFFLMKGKEISLDEDMIKMACNSKITEAEERLQYTELFLSPSMLSGIHEKVDSAHSARDLGHYSLCLSIASQAKADSNAILTSIGLSERSVREFVTSKQGAVERVISSQAQDGVFPILGYSYYEYAKTLTASEPFTALVYMEYALELSDMSIYFPQTGHFASVSIVSSWFDRVNLGFYYVLFGFGIGVLCCLLVYLLLQYRIYRTGKTSRPHWKKL